MANPYFTAAPLTVYDGDIAKASDLNNLSVAVETAFDLGDQILQTIVSDTAALISDADADVVLTHADVVLTHADVVLTHADVVLTHADVVLTHADVVLTHADAAATAIDKIATNADVVSTGLDKVATNADVISAAASASAAAASYDNFDDRYLGAKAADPTLDNDGAALLTGALYWNTAIPELRVYSGTVWTSLADSAIVGPVSAVDSQLVLFDGTTGKLAKAATTSGILKGTSGVVGAAESGTDIKTVNGTTILGAGNIAAYNPNSLTHLYHPTLDGGFRDKYRAGWLPSCYNQQWGGPQWGGLPDGSLGSVATGNIQDDTTRVLGDAAARTYQSAGRVVSETMTPPGTWVKVYKVGNPTDNLTWSMRANSAGAPTGANLFTALTLPGKQITSKTDGELYYIGGTTASLTAGTQYHEVFSRSGAVDASNYYVIKATGSSKYPHGYANAGDATPAWTATTTATLCSFLQNPAANSLLQPGGMFDYKLAFNPGNPWNQSRSVAQPLANFFDGKEFSFIHRGTYAVSSNVADFLFGLDHDRITLTTNASGYPVLSIYESDRTLAQVTGTGSVASGNHDVSFKVRTVGDGADYATLYVDGVSVGTPLTAQTFTVDKNFRELGTARLGDGFGIIPTWTQDMQMTSLPSAQGWTWTGTATEANAISVIGGKLYQNANGYASTDDGIYQKTVVLNNTTGWAVSAKLRCLSNTNSAAGAGCVIDVFDGAKRITLRIQEYFVSTGNGTSSTDFTVQGDFKTQDHIFILCGQGSNYYLLIDGVLAIDGTGKLLTANTANTINIGDLTGVAGENADAIWSYIKYYQGGMLLPIATTGTCSEFAHWSGDKSDLFAPLWNAGSPVSVKQLCGVEKNCMGEGVVQKEVRRGVTSAPTSASGSTSVLIPEMEAYVIGSEISATHQTTLLSSQAAGNVVGLSSWLDGAVGSYAVDYTALTNTGGPLLLPQEVSTSVGLHKIESKMNQGSSGTLTSSGVRRMLKVEAKS
jgi:hypothetical protein